MSTKKPTSDGSVTFDASQLASQLDAMFTTGDALRARVLGHLAQATTARSYLLERTRADLAARLGAHAPEVAKLDATIATATANATSLAAQSDLAARPTPTADPDETVIHGFVRDAENKPVAGVKLTLAEPKGTTKVTATSAKDGHFVLRHPAPKPDTEHGLELRVHDARHPTPIELEHGAGGVTYLTVHLKG